MFVLRKLNTLRVRVQFRSCYHGTCDTEKKIGETNEMCSPLNCRCPRLQNRPSLMCDIIEEKRQPFPACCPRMICQRHKKPPPPTQTQLKPFTPHAVVDKELRKIPFVLKRQVSFLRSKFARGESRHVSRKDETLSPPYRRSA